MLKQRVNVGGYNKHSVLIGANAHMKYALVICRIIYLINNY